MIEKARQYAQEVIDGTEIAPKEVQIQCKWFFEDLAKQESDGFPFYFDEDEVEKLGELLQLLNFATGLGTIGKTIYEGLAPFQAFFLCNVFGWRFKGEPTRWRYRDITLFIPRKNAKTFITATCLLLLMLTEDDHSEFYSVCLDRELAGEVKKAMTQIIQASPLIEKHFKISTTLNGKIVCKLTNSFYQARTAEANRNNSIRPAAYIADEFAAMTDYKNVTAMQSGQLNVRNPLRFKITTAYAEDKSIMLEELSYIRKVFAGSIDDQRMFALLYYASKEHLWDDIGLLQSNPLRIEANFNEIRDNRAEALEKPLKREEYLTKHCNHFLPSSSGEAYVDIEEVRKGKLDSFDWTGRPCWVGIDLSLTNDNTSVSFVTEEDGKIYCESLAFVPRDRIDEKNRLEKINYYDYIKGENPKCFSCGDATIDYGFVEEVLLSLEHKYGVSIQGFAYDRYNCLSTAQRLDRANYRVVEVKQHSSVLHAPTKLLREKILSHEFFYTDNPLLEINFINARCVENNNRDIYVNKKKSNGKVDQVVSLINALYLCQQDVVFNPDLDWGAIVL